MKTKNIVDAFRHATSPAAKLATWQNPGYGMRSPLAGNLAAIKTRASSPCYGQGGKAARLSLISSQGPELSSPEAETPLLWISSLSSPEILDAFAGRDFLNHRGWYSDDYEEETLETYAIRLARFPHLLFYGVRDSMNGDFRVRLDEWEEIDFSECESDYQAQDAIQDSARSLVRSYDDETQEEAEESREYYRKDQVEKDMEENKETLKTLRHEIRTLARELKTLCPSRLASDYPAAGKALRDSLKSLLRERRELMATNQELAASL